MPVLKGTQERISIPTETSGCNSCFGYSASVSADSSLPGRNVQQRLGQERICMCLSISVLVILHFSVHTTASLEEMYSVCWVRSVYVCVCVFIVLVILHLSVHTIALQEEMYRIGWGKSVYACACAFPSLVILHLSVHTLASLPKKLQCRLR